jgi:hypothetical protein
MLPYFSSWRLRMGAHVVGKIYNHPNPRHWDGKEITTTVVDSLDESDGRVVVVTKTGSRYSLNPECKGSLTALRRVLEMSDEDTHPG